MSILLASADFVGKNFFYIFALCFIFLGIRFIMVAKNIKIEKQKTKLDKVVVIEKMTELERFKKNVELKKIELNLCEKENNKDICLALGNCVWAKATDNNNVIEKCLNAESTDNSKDKGSEGPTDICYCSSKGKLIPWDNYYYSKGEKVIEKKGPICSAKGNSCKN